jgi:hypothetical protein
MGSGQWGVHSKNITIGYHSINWTQNPSLTSIIYLQQHTNRKDFQRTFL